MHKNLIDTLTTITTHHEIGIANMMLDYTTAQNNHARLLGMHGLVVDATNIGHQVQNKARTFVRVKINHVTQRAVGDGRTVDWNVILVAPIVNRCWVIDFLA